MIWRRLFTAALLISVPFLLLLILSGFKDKTVIGEVIQLEKTKLAFTGERITLLTLRDEATGANCFLAIEGHTNSVGVGERLQVRYSTAEPPAARVTTPLGHQREYYWVHDFAILFKESRH